MPWRLPANLRAPLRRLLLTGLTAASAAASSAAYDLDRQIVGYFTSWSIYGRNFHVADIPAERVSAVNYAFANIADGEIALGDPYADIDRWYPGDSWHPDSLRGCFHQLQILKREHPHLRTLISVGGWTWSDGFSDAALTQESRARFAASCVAFVERYGFDGVDIDWEYPVSGGMPGNTVRPEDRENFTLLLAEIRSQLDDAGTYLLTIAAPASPFVIPNIEIDRIHESLDWINLMTYDFHGPWGGDGDPVTHLNAPLDAAGDDPLGEPFRSAFNVRAAVSAYLDAGGVPASKLHVGLPFYGRGYGGVQGGADGLFAPYAGPSPGGTWEPGVFDFWDLSRNYIDRDGYRSYRHAEAGVPWLHNAVLGVTISYDDSLAIAGKCADARAQGLGGVMLWEFSADRDGVLSEAAYRALETPVAGVPWRADAVRNLLAVPSPLRAGDSFRIEGVGGEIIECAIFDPAGRRLGGVRAATGDAGVRICQLAESTPPGVYLIRLRTARGSTAARIVVIP